MRRVRLSHPAVSVSLLALALAGGAPSATSAAASAAETAPAPDATSVGEIVVTATRQAQALSKVAISVSAYSRQSLDEQDIKDIADITRLTPGLVFQTTRTTTNIAIRGVNSTAGAATTGVYIDDTPIQIRVVGYGGGTAYPEVFDLDRVEVLRGPQGTLFGAGSEGGTIRYITPAPSLTTYSGYGRAEVAYTENGDPSYEAGVAVGGPIVKDELGFRASVWYRRDGGYIDRGNDVTGAVTEPNANYHDNYAARVSLAWAPAPGLKITPAVYYQFIYKNNLDSYWLNISDESHQHYVNGDPVQGVSRDQFILPSLNIDYVTKDVELVGIVSYFDRRQSADYDYTLYDQSLFTGITYPLYPNQMAVGSLPSNQQNYTGEFRVQSVDPNARLHWVFGVFLSQATQVGDETVRDTFFPDYIQAVYGVPSASIFGPLLDGQYIYSQAATVTDKQAAGYGQIDYKPIRRLTLTAGVRVARTEVDVSSLAEGPVVGPPAIDHGVQRETPVTPKFEATYQLNADNLVYASAAKGYRPGGYNPTVGVPCGAELASDGLTAAPQLYASDSVWSYELGAKNKLFDRHLQIGASVYQIDWSNIQQLVNLNSCGFSFVANLGSARSRGFDLQAAAYPMTGLTLSATVGYTDAKFLQTITGGPDAKTPIVSAGDGIVGAPWTFTVTGEYEFEVMTRKAYVRADYDYQSHQDSSFITDPRNGSYDPTIPNVPALNYAAFRVGMRLPTLDLSLFINNAFNSTAETSLDRVNGLATIYRATTQRPRTIGLTAIARY
jgi:outer membrane receptor protein involved in Fe transport